MERVVLEQTASVGNMKTPVQSLQRGSGEGGAEGGSPWRTDMIQNSSLHANEDPKVTNRAAFYRGNSHGALDAQDC